MARIALKKARLSLNLSQDDLGEKLGISNRTVSDYETGKVKQGKPEIWDKLETIFGVPQKVLRQK
jgi:transcriptional regulator with XRE-family HTH domain